MAYLPGQQYVQNASGVWTPVGYGAGNVSAPVAIRDANTSRNGLVGTFGPFNVAELSGLVNTTFYSTTSITDNYNTANTGSATSTVTLNDGFALLSTGTTNPSTVQITSKDFATYNGIGELMFLNGIRAPQAGVAGVIKRWGAYDSNNGYFVEDNAGTFRVVSRKNAVDTAVSSGSFNGSLGSTYTLDQNGHFFQILMTGGRAVFMIDQAALHTLATPAGSTTTSGSLNLPIRVEIISTQAVNQTLEIRGQNIGRLGPVDSKKINETILDGNDAELTRAILAGYTAPNVYTNVSVSASGGLSIKGTALAAQTGSLAGATTGTIGPWSVNEANNATFFVKNTVAGTAYTGAPVFVFEQSDDNVSWGPLPVTRGDTGATLTTHTLPAGTANGELAFNTGIIGANWVRIRATTGTTANGITVVMDAGTMPFVPSVSLMGALPAGLNFLGSVNTGLSPTAVLGAASGNIAAPFYASGTAAFVSASVIAAPGAGLSIYVTDMEGSNEGATGTAVSFAEGAATPVRYRRFMGASGGGFVSNLKTPWKLPANTAMFAAVSAATTWNYTVNYYVAP